MECWVGVEGGGRRQFPNRQHLKAAAIKLQPSAIPRRGTSLGFKAANVGKFWIFG
jgi:hypothetical protein